MTHRRHQTMSGVWQRSRVAYPAAVFRPHIPEQRDPFSELEAQERKEAAN